MHKLIIDSCACTRLAEAGVDPVAALAGSEFSIALTPDLRTEYRNKLLSRYASPSEKALAEAILKGAATHGFFGYAGTGGWAMASDAWRQKLISQLSNSSAPYQTTRITVARASAPISIR